MIYENLTKPHKSYASVSRPNPSEEWQEVKYGNRRTAAQARTTRPSARGTKPSELHLRVGTSEAIRNLKTKSGIALGNAVTGLINETISEDERKPLKDNPIIAVKWSLRGNLILSCANPMDELVKGLITRAIDHANEDTSEVLNRKPITLLKFPAVATYNLDGSNKTEDDLINDIRSHEKWVNVVFSMKPKFITPRGQSLGASAVVLIGVEDDDSGSVGKRLENTLVQFSCGARRCLRWIVANGARQCSTCLRWGHPAYHCRSQKATCAICGEEHNTSTHVIHCATCKSGSRCIPQCVNCGGAHEASAVACPFYLSRFDDAKIRQLQKLAQERRLMADLKRAETHNDTLPPPPTTVKDTSLGPNLSSPPEQTSLEQDTATMITDKPSA